MEGQQEKRRGRPRTNGGINESEITVAPREKSASDQVKKIYQKNKLLYRYSCPACSKKTYYHHVMQNHVETKKHKQAKQNNDQQYDYIAYKNTLKLEHDGKDIPNTKITVGTKSSIVTPIDDNQRPT